MRASGGKWRRAGVVLSLLIACGARVGIAHADATDSEFDYHPGRGLRIPGTGFTLGGYATGSLDNLSGDSSRLALDNLSMFIWWEGRSRWKFFSEIEYENFADIRKESKGEDDYLSLERAYLDYALTDTSTLRIGKFLTPVGRWNVIHATPLVWTTSRPLATSLAFPTNMTGLMWTGTLPSIGNGLEYSIYASSNGQIRPNPDVDPFFRALGLHLSLPLSPYTRLGFSYANFSQSRSRSERKHLVGLDYVWTHDRFELSAEAVYRSSNQGSRRDEKGAYVQLVAPLSKRLFAVGRYEVYRRALEPATTRLRVAGLAYQLNSTLILKAEWVSGRHNTIRATTGFLSSISVLF